MIKKYKFIDLFAGIGGFHHAFHELGAECVFASEIDPYARKTYECNLARYVRKRLQALGIKKGLKVVFSSEKPDQSRIIETENAYPKKSIIGTLSYMPAIFGCTVASVVIRDLMAID